MHFKNKLNLPMRLFLRLNFKKRLIAYLILLSLIICMYLTFSTSNVSNEIYNKEVSEHDFESFKLIINDSYVNIDSYIEEYDKVRQIKSQISQSYKIVSTNQRKVFLNSTFKPDYLILEYTKIFGRTKYCDGSNTPQKRSEIILSQCPYKNCLFTCDRQYTQNAHVLLFHESDLKNDVRNDADYMKQVEINRKKEQIWLLWNDEANSVSSIIDNYKFNWTMSYRYDSEVSDCSYGCKYSKKYAYGYHNKSSNEEEMAKKKSIDDMINVFFNLRKNKAIWFVSNCDSKYRLDYAAQLAHHFPVDVLGYCEYIVKLKRTLPSFISTSYLGHMSIVALNAIVNVLSSAGSGTSACKSNTMCEMKYLTDTKFYLSFESKNCSYYVTEKFWRILRAGLIPVVFQPNKEFYELIAPTHSYIHAQDFDYDVKRLSHYLNSVSTNIDLYAKHMKWKYDYDVVYSSKQCESRRLCELCTRLNEDTSYRYYESVSAFFNHDCKVN